MRIIRAEECFHFSEVGSGKTKVVATRPLLCIPKRRRFAPDSGGQCDVALDRLRRWARSKEPTLARDGAVELASPRTVAAVARRRLACR